MINDDKAIAKSNANQQKYFSLAFIVLIFKELSIKKGKTVFWANKKPFQNGRVSLSKWKGFWGFGMGVLDFGIEKRVKLQLIFFNFSVKCCESNAEDFGSFGFIALAEF